MESVEPDVDHESIRDTLGGSPVAFERILRRYQGDVRMIVSKWVRCPAAADDIAQEVFVAAYENLERFDGQGSMRSWLVGIAKNKAKLYLRTESRRRNHESALQRHLQGWKAQQLEKERTWDIDEQSTLMRCIETLAPASKKLVEKHYFGGKTLESLARESNRTGGSLRMMLMRIRKALATCMRGQP